MLIAIENYIPWSRFGEETALKLIKNAGFDCVDFSLFFDASTHFLDDSYVEKALHTKKLLEENNLLCNQAHAPFDFTYGDTMDCSCAHFLAVTRAIEYAAIIGAKHIVVHGIRVPSSSGTEESLEYNYQYYKSLEPYAKKFGIQIALENLAAAFSVPYMMNEMLKRLDSTTFVVCVDVGHAPLCRVPAESYIRAVPAEKLKGLHIHDNRGIEDDHLLPGFGILPWDKILEAIALSGYNGDFTLEITRFMRATDVNATSEALSFAAATGRSMVQKIESYKN